MCSRQAVTGCFTYLAASKEELVALDGVPGPFLVPLFTLSERRFSQKMVASKCYCDDHNLSQFLSCFRSQHDSLSCCRIRDNDSNKAVQLCN